MPKQKTAKFTLIPSPDSRREVSGSTGFSLHDVVRVTTQSGGHLDAPQIAVMNAKIARLNLDGFISNTEALMESVRLLQERVVEQSRWAGHAEAVIRNRDTIIDELTPKPRRSKPKAIKAPKPKAA